MRATNNKQLITDNGRRESSSSEVISYWSSVISSRGGQSLIEVVIGLAIGSILIGASAFAISTMLQTNLASQKGQAATAFSQELLNKARVYGSADWQSLYGLTKASSTQYFLNASGTAYAVVQGKEGMLDNDVTNGLVVEWKFDEDAASTSTMTYDATGNGNNGTLMNSPAYATSTCKIANCLNFNGTNNYVVTTSTLSLPLAASSRSLFGWIKTSGALGRMNYFGYGGATTNLAFDISSGIYGDGKIYFIGYAAGDVAGTKVISDGTWHHVGATYDGTTVRVYVDGVLDVSGVRTLNTSNVNTYPFVVGRQSYGDGAAFWYAAALIDDVRLYNRALSADEVRQLYNSNIFTRYFYVENTCRTNNASSSISGVSPCGSGSADDPSTQKVTAITQWIASNGPGQTSLSDFLTRWKNVIFQQTDWSGGSGASGPVTSPSNTFTSSTGANYSGGSIRIQGL